MRIIYTLALLFTVARCIHAQTTIVRTYPSDTIDLACATCQLKIVDMALTTGQQSIPLNLNKPVAKNLFHWVYFDEISQEKVITPDEPIWTQHTQLLDEIGEQEVLSLHLNLQLTDSTHRQYRINIVMAGINKSALNDLPMETNFDPDTYQPFRFSAIVQIVPVIGGAKETYDCIEGMAYLNEFDPRKLKLSGSFEFKSNKIGVEKRAFFINGAFNSQ